GGQRAPAGHVPLPARARLGPEPKVADPGANQSTIDEAPAGGPVTAIVPVPTAPASVAAERRDASGTGGSGGGGPAGRIPIGLVASVVVHLGLAGLVAAAFF